MTVAAWRALEETTDMLPRTRDDSQAVSTQSTPQRRQGTDLSCSIQVLGHPEKCPSKFFLLSIGYLKSLTTWVVDSILFNLLSQVRIINGEFSSHVNFNCMVKEYSWSSLDVNYFYLLKNHKRKYTGEYVGHYNGSNFKCLLPITFCSWFLSPGPCVQGLTSQWGKTSYRRKGLKRTGGVGSVVLRNWISLSKSLNVSVPQSEKEYNRYSDFLVEFW